jgi:exosortase/archaeosortase family protein
MKRIIKIINAELSKYVDTAYLARFTVLLVVLYYFNYFYVALVDKKGLLYSALLDDHLNYVACVRKSLLYTSNAINHLIGINSFVVRPDQIKTVNGSYVEILYACLGLGISSFWLAFVIADKNSLKRKIAWSLGGLICLWFINVWRITVLLIAHEHHTQFNLVAYLMIVLMAWLYLKSNKKSITKHRSGNFLLSRG